MLLMPEVMCSQKSNSSCTKLFSEKEALTVYVNRSHVICSVDHEMGSGVLSNSFALSGKVGGRLSWKLQW